MNCSSTPHTITPRSLVLAALALSLPLVSGCEDDPDPIIGRWESTDPIGNSENTLEIDSDMRGESRIYFYQGDGYYYADFDVDVRVIEKGARYELDLSCEGNCGELDFEMECDLITDDRLECEGDGTWSTYDFEWEPN